MPDRRLGSKDNVGTSFWASGLSFATQQTFHVVVVPIESRFRQVSGVAGVRQQGNIRTGNGYVGILSMQLRQISEELEKHVFIKPLSFVEIPGPRFVY